MIRTTIRPSGLVNLGAQARALGFTRGAVIEVIPTSAGSLIVVLDDAPLTVDVTWKPLWGAAAHHNRSRRRQLAPTDDVDGPREPVV